METTPTTPSQTSSKDDIQALDREREDEIVHVTEKDAMDLQDMVNGLASNPRANTAIFRAKGISSQ